MRRGCLASIGGRRVPTNEAASSCIARKVYSRHTHTTRGLDAEERRAGGPRFTHGQAFRSGSLYWIHNSAGAQYRETVRDCTRRTPTTGAIVSAEHIKKQHIGPRPCG